MIIVNKKAYVMPEIAIDEMEPTLLETMSTDEQGDVICQGKSSIYMEDIYFEEDFEEEYEEETSMSDWNTLSGW